MFAGRSICSWPAFPSSSQSDLQHLNFREGEQSTPAVPPETPPRPRRFWSLVSWRDGVELSPPLDVLEWEGESKAIAMNQPPCKVRSPYSLQFACRRKVCRYPEESLQPSTS